jgi:hypothetical protein
LSCSGSGTGSSSSDSRKGSSADVSFCCGAPSVGASAVGVFATFDLARLASGRGHSATAYFPFRLLSAIAAIACSSSCSSSSSYPLTCSPSSLSVSFSESEMRSLFYSGRAKTPPPTYRPPVICSCSPRVRLEDKKSSELASTVLSSSVNAVGLASFISVSSSLPHCCLRFLSGTISSSSSNSDMAALDGRNSCRSEGSVVGFTLTTYICCRKSFLSSSSCTHRLCI